MPDVNHRTSPPLACPVRSCSLPLVREGGVWRCARGHSFDVARSGYVNLLQPQDRRSPDAGDPVEAIDARARLLAASIGHTILDAFVTRAASLVASQPGPPLTVADLGCGSGDALGRLHARAEVCAVGIDLATHAVHIAARRFPSLTWVVANADRRLPLLDGHVSLALSLHARRNPDECARILPSGGHLVAAVPAPDDLIELREAIQGTGVQRDRVAMVIAEHEGSFALVDRFVVRERHHVSGEQLRDLLRGTYRGERASTAHRADALAPLDVTLASDVVVLRRR